MAIQLISDPKDQKKDPKEQGEVYTPNDATELWTLAKAVFGNLDFCAHSAMSCCVAPPSICTDALHWHTAVIR